MAPFISIFTALLLLCALPAHAEGERLGILEQVVGMVRLERAGEPGFRAARSGMVLRAGDRLGTNGGKALVTMNDGSRLGLAEETQAAIERPEEKKSGVLVRLFGGMVRAKVAKQTGDKSFHVKTLSATAGVRGTDFVVHAREGASFFYQKEGAVGVDAAGGEVILNPDRMTANASDRRPMAPATISADPQLAATLKKLDAFTDPVVPPAPEQREKLRALLVRYYINRASLLTDKKSYYDAETSLLVAHELAGRDRDKSEILSLIANIHARFLNDPKSAFLYYQATLERHPATPHYQSALFQIGLVLEAMGEPERARDYFQRYLKEFPRGDFRLSAESRLGGP